MRKTSRFTPRKRFLSATIKDRYYSFSPLIDQDYFGWLSKNGKTEIGISRSVDALVKSRAPNGFVKVQDQGLRDFEECSVLGVRACLQGVSRKFW